MAWERSSSLKNRSLSTPSGVLISFQVFLMHRNARSMKKSLGKNMHFLWQNLLFMPDFASYFSTHLRVESDRGRGRERKGNVTRIIPRGTIQDKRIPHRFNHKPSYHVSVGGEEHTFVGVYDL